MGQTKERIQSWVLFLGDMVCIIAAYYIAGHLWLQGFKGYSLGETMNLLSNNILTIFVAGMLTSLF